MAKLAIGVATALVIVLLLGFYLGNSDAIKGTRVSSVDIEQPEGFLLIESRLAKLESLLEEERAARRQLQLTVESLLDNSLVGEPDISFEDSESNTNADFSDLTQQQRRQQFLERSGERQANRLARRMERLHEAGFPPSQAEYILQREEEIRLENLNTQWEQRRKAFLEENANRDVNPLREELGEADYERYLQATGRSTSVYVSQLVGNSQAVIAGFQAGDEIIRYNGERVYNFNDLNLANVQGELGEAVLIDIVRGGMPMQLTVERGPLGIVGGRQRGFRGP